MLASRISKNFVWLFSGNFISQSIVFVSLVLVANNLSPEQFGRFSFAQSILVFLVRVVEFGLDTVAIRRIAQHSDSDRLVSAVFSLRAVFTSIIIVSSVVVAGLFFGDAKTSEVFLILVLSLIGVASTLEWYYQAHERMHIVGYIRLVRSVLFFLPILFFMTGERSEITVAWFYTLSFIGTSLIFLVVYFREHPVIYFGDAINNMKGIFIEGVPIGISNLLFQTPFIFGTLIIGLCMTSSDVGFFSVAFKPAIAIWSFGIIAAYNAFFPVLSSIAHDRPKTADVVRRLSRIFNVAGMFLFLSLAPLAGTIIDLLYAEQYRGSEYIFQFTLVVVGIVMARAGIEYSLLATNNRKEYFIGAIVVTVSYIVFCTAGVYISGIPGVLVGSIIAESIYTVYVFMIHQFDEIRNSLLFHFGAIMIVTAVLYLGYSTLDEVPFIVRYGLVLSIALITVLTTKLLTVDQVVSIFRNHSE